MRIRGVGRIKQLSRSLRNRFSPGCLILLYHRVAELPTDPQLLSVSPSHFDEQLAVIKQLGAPVSLKNLTEALRHKEVPRKSIVITFDDGAADNLRTARPLLEKHNLPATVFVSTGFVKNGREYWWDELDRLVLQPNALPEQLQLMSSRGAFTWNLADSLVYGPETFAEHRSWNVSHSGKPTDRHRLYSDLINFFLPLSASERISLLDELSELTGNLAPPRDTHRALTAGEIRQLAAGGLVEIGAHTVNHPMLSALSRAEQSSEIEESKKDLEEIMGQKIESFAYPFGTLSDYTPETVTLVKQSGFRSACSNFRDVVQPDSDLFQLPRVIVRDWGADEFGRRIEKWFKS